LTAGTQNYSHFFYFQVTRKGLATFGCI